MVWYRLKLLLFKILMNFDRRFDFEGVNEKTN